jgi:copper chaperone
MTDTHTYEFSIAMSCGGCSGAIDRVLKKLEGMFLRSTNL